MSNIELDKGHDAKQNTNLAATRSEAEKMAEFEKCTDESGERTHEFENLRRKDRIRRRGVRAFSAAAGASSAAAGASSADATAIGTAADATATPNATPSHAKPRVQAQPHPHPLSRCGSSRPAYRCSTVCVVGVESLLPRQHAFRSQSYHC